MRWSSVYVRQVVERVGNKAQAADLLGIQPHQKLSSPTFPNNQLKLEEEAQSATSH